MADVLKMDPARIARLRDPARLSQVDPERLLEVVSPVAALDVVDVGAGVGFVSLPLARRLPASRIVACDILPGMLGLLTEAARAEGLTNLHCAPMAGSASLPLADDSAGALVMLQVHHELDDPVALLRECLRVLHPGAPVAIVDWKDERLPGIPPGGRRVPQADIVEHLNQAGFTRVRSHDLYPYHCTLTATA